MASYYFLIANFIAEQHREMLIKEVEETIPKLIWR